MPRCCVGGLPTSGVATVTDKSRRELEEAYDGLEKEVPDAVARTLRWLRDPRSRWVRLPVGILLMLLSTLSFLPIIGLELLPLGLLLVAQDVPFLRKPAARMMLWFEDAWRVVKRWWRSRKR